jgi:hypothetical protein
MSTPVYLLQFGRALIAGFFWVAVGAAPVSQVEVFDTNRVARIEIKLAEAHWNELRYQHREAEFFPEEGKAPPEDPYTWFPAEVTINGADVGRGEVRKKGYIGSNDIRRPALKLRVSVRGNERLDLTLNNNRQDPSLIRQYLAYEVFRRAEVPAPRCSFARVVINGKDVGIYTSLEPINANFLKQHFPSANGNLYEGGRSDFRSNWVQNFQIKNKRKDNQPSAAPRADLETATVAIEKSETSILSALNSHFDADQFFRFWAIECLINETDGYAANMNNFYLYNNPATGKFVFIPWGADSTFNSRRPLNSAPGDPRSVIGVGILAHRLYNSEEGAAKYRATLRSMLEKVWDEKALLSEVNRVEALLSPFVQSESANFKANVESVRRFIKSRRTELNPELEGPVPTLNSKPLELATRRVVGRFTGKFSTAAGLRQASAELSGTLWDQPLTFRETAFDLQTASGEEGIFFQIVAVTEGGQRHFIYLGIDPDSVTTAKPIPIDNTRIQGTFGSDGRYVGMLRGSLVLSKASKTGGEMAGEFTVDVFSKQPKP